MVHQFRRLTNKQQTIVLLKLRLDRLLLFNLLEQFRIIRVELLYLAAEVILELFDASHRQRSIDQVDGQTALTETAGSSNSVQIGFVVWFAGAGLVWQIIVDDLLAGEFLERLVNRYSQMATNSNGVQMIS